MNEIIFNFSDIIQDFSTSKEGIIGEKEIERAIILFIDSTRLVVCEAKKGTKFKYSYHWMSDRNKTLYRWDNTPHFPAFSTFPCHRYVGELEIAESFAKVSLEDVLLFIANQLS